MILFISSIGESLPIVYRMIKGGLDTKIYIHNHKYKHNYDGILDKVELNDLKKTMMDAEKIIFDSNVKIGSMADDFTFKAIAIPTLVKETELTEKAGIKARKTVSGVRIIAEMWFNGKEPVLFVYSLPNREWLTGGLGLEMASQSNCLWVGDGNGILSSELKAIAPLLTAFGYVGPVSVDCTVNSKDKKPYLNNWKIGFRYDSIFCLLALSKSVSSFFVDGYNIDANTGSFACSERITISPYPYTEESLLDELAKDVNLNIDLDANKLLWGQDIKREDKEVKCAGNDGVLGVMASTGKSIEGGFGEIFKAIRRLNVDSPLQFRIDGAKESNKSYKKLKDWDICIN